MTSPTDSSVFPNKLPIQYQPAQVAHRHTHPEYLTNIAQHWVSSFTHGKVPAGLSLTSSIVPTTNALCQVIHPTRAHSTKILEALKPPFAPTTSMWTPTPYSLPVCPPIYCGHQMCPHHPAKPCLSPHSGSITTAHLMATSITLQPSGSIDNTLTAYQIPMPIHHLVQISTHPQIPILTSLQLLVPNHEPMPSTTCCGGRYTRGYTSSGNICSQPEADRGN